MASVLLPDEQTPEQQGSASGKKRFWQRYVVAALRADDQHAHGDEAEPLEDIDKISTSSEDHLQQMFFKDDVQVDVLFGKESFELRSDMGITETSFADQLLSCTTISVEEGKSGAVFSKSSDGRLIVKEVIPEDVETFQRIGEAYFEHIRNPTLIAKILGSFRVKLSGVCFNLMVYQCVSGGDTWFDLKGVHRSDHGDHSDTGFLNPIPLNPTSHAKFFEALTYDCDFFEGMQIVDYSLLVFKRNDVLSVGMVDYLLTYKWKFLRLVKHLKLMIKYNRGTTIASPSAYKKRMIKQFKRYFPLA